MKNQKGITLIALVITIIVLLILAGVSIAMLTGDNGIITKATEATTNTKRGEAKEAVRLGVATIITENEGTLDKNTITKDNLKAAIQEANSNAEVKITEEDMDITGADGTPSPQATLKTEVTIGDATYTCNVVIGTGKIIEK